VSQSFELHRFIEHPSQEWNTLLTLMPQRIQKWFPDLLEFLRDYKLSPTFHVQRTGWDEMNDPIITVELIFDEDAQAVLFKLWFEPHKKYWPKFKQMDGTFKYREVINIDYK